MDSLFDILLGKSLSGGGGGGGGGTSNYNALENKPQINGTTLTGNKSLSDLGIAAASDIPTVNNGTLTIQKNGTKIDEFKANQSANTTINITVPTTASDVSALPDTTKYAASSTAGGSATSAVKLDNAADAGATNKPVYFNNGKPTAIAYEVNKTVPADAVFTDTTYESKAAASGGTAVSLVTTGEKYTWNNKSDLELGNTATTAAAGNHTHTLNIATDAGTSQISLAPNTKYKLTGGGETYVFTTPADTTYTFDGTYSASTNKAATVSTVTNAINALDVTGDSGISAAKTISAWSETDGKVSVSTQDIAITGTQAVLTGYQKSTTAGQAVVATDNVNQAIGKVEKRVSDNENNISLINHAANTSLYFSETQPTGTITVGSYWISTSGIAVYGGTATASTYTITFTADSGTLTDWTISGNATQSSTPTPTSPVAVSGVGDLVESGEHSGEYDISITCGGETNHVYIADMLLKIESYADSVSKTAISRRIKKITLTGNETITGVHANSDNTAYCATLKYSDIGMTDIIDYDKYMNNISYPKYISTHFTNKSPTENTAYYNISAGEMGANSTASAQNRYIILCVSGLTTAQDYTDWLTTQYNNNTPVEIYYITATATETAITTPDIPTVSGSNTFTVGTTINPSAVSVSYQGWSTNQ